ncbi:hypothetical protein F5Y00DRAFT_161033 [Daldinia vernicosa]|uniref:uncharacterized protein n=1 Tax=Daldinia vernicosa TaxID=114800 RepID=UPI00200813FB|nr:uncharacterized protein F5Y00DRAFT_161033 [Daldinia vernicosa]KAI0845842.1 hypothetical protein F5Y00DRAFT_161033 [Daldinia vernicosa]
MAIIIYPLAKGSVHRDYRRLGFLLSGMRRDAATSIDKAIVFIDNFNRLIGARHYLLNVAIGLGLSPDEAASLIRAYHDVHTRPNDRKRLFNDFAKEDSRCRIILATVSRGMGMDFRNVKRVVQYGPIASGNLADLIQRFGEAAQDAETQSTAYFFPPYWYLDLLGLTKAEAGEAPSRNVTSKAKPAQRNYPKIVGAEDSGTESSISTLSSTVASIASGEIALPRVDPTLGQFGIINPKTWSEAEENYREKLQSEQPDIYGFVNASCFRKYMLQFLQQPEDDNLEGAKTVPTTKCCNACHNELGRLPRLPPKPPTDRAPKKGSVQWFALQEIDAFCDKQAEIIFASLNCRVKVPGGVLMPYKRQWKVANAFTAEATEHNISQLVEDVLQHIDLEERDRVGPALCEASPAMLRESRLNHQKHLADKRNEREAR